MFLFLRALYPKDYFLRTVFFSTGYCDWHQLCCVVKDLFLGPFTHGADHVHSTSSVVL
ncbi:MAG: hypothetical protein ACI8PG_002082 [Planctomycetota bacterium]|jgi:hypothetical protein